MRDPSNVQLLQLGITSHCMHYAMPLLAVSAFYAVRSFAGASHRAAACRIAYNSFGFVAGWQMEGEARRNCLIVPVLIIRKLLVYLALLVERVWCDLQHIVFQ
jgi:hypothetical protein